ncbi:uncharacterized protein AMSG_04107 [Thecamonas trahens ATCC 50062]|uniref:Uncharacterized protein n=1 Tax=Thecamonas trahens ATCC 50062 TaxID=461836 RepID=A0A0L0D664_THETB|nr:hypothetical protein AMSG_04107 [Thecamonas trahens ATCC 50062]KNC47877.1 hypothetical protein AMSG_04107 [Thecamonas trahens ATCC 50062]|eukprot:XP_013759355.1 hypothetical protein AMSG_04107 [Thecamonas trahens ATCC 50062]
MGDEHEKNEMMTTDLVLDWIVEYAVAYGLDVLVQAVLPAGGEPELAARVTPKTRSMLQVHILDKMVRSGEWASALEMFDKVVPDDWDRSSESAYAAFHLELRLQAVLAPLRSPRWSPKKAKATLRQVLDEKVDDALRTQLYELMRLGSNAPEMIAFLDNEHPVEAVLNGLADFFMPMISDRTPRPFLERIAAEVVEGSVSLDDAAAMASAALGARTEAGSSSQAKTPKGKEEKGKVDKGKTAKGKAGKGKTPKGKEEKGKTAKGKTPKNKTSKGKTSKGKSGTTGKKAVASKVADDDLVISMAELEELAGGESELVKLIEAEERGLVLTPRRTVAAEMSSDSDSSSSWGARSSYESSSYDDDDDDEATQAPTRGLRSSAHKKTQAAISQLGKASAALLSKVDDPLDAILAKSSEASPAQATRKRRRSGAKATAVANMFSSSDSDSSSAVETPSRRKPRATASSKSKKPARSERAKSKGVVVAWTDSDDEVSDVDDGVSLPPAKSRKIEISSTPSRRPRRLSKSQAIAALTPPNKGRVSKASISARKRRRWTDDEIKWLIEGVAQFGHGNWAAILAAFPFTGRTNVNLKDKWRTLEKQRNL